MRVIASPASGRQKRVGYEEDEDDVESIFPLLVEPELTRVAAPMGMITRLLPLGYNG